MTRFSVTKSILFFSFIAFVHLNLATGQSEIQSPTKVKKMDTLSYSAGIVLAKSLMQNGINELNYEDFTDGLKSVLKNEPGKISQEEAHQTLNEYVTTIQEKKSKLQIERSAKFLIENKKRPEVTTTDSGLQYEVLTAGDGPIPKATDKVKTHYHGTLLDGSVFDSSVERGEPISFPVNGVIQGWQEALQLMPVGSKWKLFIPYSLAYGERGAGGMIGPYETLIFEIELLGIE